ncbi:hypothetical protein ElyMa_003917900 [Elysia marginata]|uniref:Uncharacterized protein n=1 Tax=Elysia marginata TaxID=1093978 RepID=A0AAV4FPZ9_9GAST|nr:hypothetical protein ElyMa_003917900 [Elysia marginata]
MFFRDGRAYIYRALNYIRNLFAEVVNAGLPTQSLNPRPYGPKAERLLQCRLITTSSGLGKKTSIQNGQRDQTNRSATRAEFAHSTKRIIAASGHEHSRPLINIAKFIEEIKTVAVVVIVVVAAAAVVVVVVAVLVLVIVVK